VICHISFSKIRIAKVGGLFGNAKGIWLLAIGFWPLAVCLEKNQAILAKLQRLEILAWCAIANLRGYCGSGWTQGNPLKA
jgi:hypothetical protein